MYLNQKARVERLSPTQSDNDKEQYATIIPSIPINVQPSSSELLAVAGGVYGKTYTGFITYSGMQIGDRVTISGTNKTLIVQGVADWNYGPLPHLEITLFEGDN